MDYPEPAGPDLPDRHPSLTPIPGVVPLSQSVSPEPKLETVPLDPTRIVDESTPVDQARRLLPESPGTLIITEGSGGRRALRELDLRNALQTDQSTRLRLLELTQSEMTCASMVEAQDRLEGNRDFDAVLVDDGDPATIRSLQIHVEPIRTAVVMAGGRGERLRPLTNTTPKPLLQIRGRSLLFRTLDRLRHSGVRRVYISVFYLGEQIKEAVGDGSAFDMEVTYLEEKSPLDTGAGLALLDRMDEPFFLVNGDLLTDLNLQAIARFHQLQRADGAVGTVATFRYAAPLPYGVVHSDRDRIERIEEKPVFRYPVNAGIYVFSPEVLGLVEKGRPLAMVDFLNAQAGGGAIRRFPLAEAWNDVGSHNDFARAQQDPAAEPETS